MTTILALIVASLLAFAPPEPKPSLSLFYRTPHRSVDGRYVAWGVWDTPDGYDVWLADLGAPPRLLAFMPLGSTSNVQFLVWEDAKHLLYGVSARGGNATVRETWRIGLDGRTELVEHTETSP